MVPHLFFRIHARLENRRGDLVVRRRRFLAKFSGVISGIEGPAQTVEIAARQFEAFRLNVFQDALHSGATVRMPRGNASVDAVSLTSRGQQFAIPSH